MYDSMLNLLSYMGTMWLTNGELRPPGLIARLHRSVAGVRGEGRVLVVATRQEVFWRRLCDAMGCRALADDPKFSTNALRVQNRDALVPRLEEIFRGRSVDEWIAVMRAADVPAAPVNNLDRAFGSRRSPSAR